MCFSNRLITFYTITIKVWHIFVIKDWLKHKLFNSFLFPTVRGISKSANNWWTYCKKFVTTFFLWNSKKCTIENGTRNGLLEESKLIQFVPCVFLLQTLFFFTKTKTHCTLHICNELLADMDARQNCQAMKSVVLCITLRQWKPVNIFSFTCTSHTI